MAMYALLTATGNDRPGIVSAMTGVLLEKGCNVEDSTMARLGGDFVIMLVLQMPEGGDWCELEGELRTAASGMGLSLQLAELSEEHAVGRVSTASAYEIHVYGADQKGIVAKVTQRLADSEVNIANLNTHVIPHATPLYVMMIEVELPRGVDAGALGEDLRQLGRDIGVQITVRPKGDARF